MTEQNYAAMRRAMVESQLRTNDVNDPRVIAAMLAVPRELFVPAERREAAYIDRAVKLTADRALNPPLATGRLLVEAQVAPGQRVLLIGAATGYAAALLAELGAEVTAVEVDPALLETARDRLAGRAGVTLVGAALPEGAAQGAPYDILFIDGAVEELPRTLIEQLRPGGRAVFGQLSEGVTRLCVGTRSAGGFGALSLADAECVALPGFAKPRRFSF
jgi:protein-L-isoaspartate(D-aspartate) O-methyltransferase